MEWTTYIDDISAVPSDAWPALIAMRHAHEHEGLMPLEQCQRYVAEQLVEQLAADDIAFMFVAPVSPLPAPNDPLNGIRPVWLSYPRHPYLTKVIRSFSRRLRWTDREAKHILDWGRLRAGAVDTENINAHKSHKVFARLVGTRHRAIGIAPLNPRLESYVIAKRSDDRPFQPADVALLLGAAYTLSPVLRSWAVRLGLFDGLVLTPREREVLHELLVGRAEKEGAEALGLRPASFHQVAVAVYRKLNVQSRGELMAKCLGAPPQDALPWSHRFLDVGRRDKKRPLRSEESVSEVT